MSCYKIVDELSSDASKLKKEAIVLREAKANNTEFFDGFRMAYDPMITFGVKQVPEKLTPNQTGTFTFQDFCALAGQLAQRKLTGNAARDALEAAMSRATVADWNGWYRRILLKDMRCGATEGTINRVTAKKFPQFSIPLFECQLAHDGANHENKLVGKKLLDFKLDGVRVLAVIQSGVVTLHSRNGRVFENFPHIEAQIAKVAKDLEADWVLDGEITSRSFQDLMKQVHRKTDADASDAVFNLFDAVPLAAFRAGRYDVSQLERSNNLRDLMGHFRAAGCNNIQALDFKPADLDTAEGRELLDSMREQAKTLGLEGIMVKSADAPYECKRSAAWLKLKPFIEVSLEVTNLEEGTGKNVGRLGALVCSGQDDGKDITVNVGSGFSDDLRTGIWGDRGSVVGQIVEVRADAVTQNQDGTYSLRFPRFMRFRGFAPGEKI